MTWCPLCSCPAGGVAEPAERYRGYRVPSARLPAFDYGRGVFFVTVVTAGREPWFGRLADGVAILSPAGRVVAEEWHRTGVVRVGVTVDALVVMPDHVHGILALHGDDAVGRDVAVGRGIEETPHRGVSTGPSGNRAWRPGVLGAVIGRWKSECTRRIRKEHPGFAWQTRFHDKVIRNDAHLESARRYIAENPMRAQSS